MRGEKGGCFRLAGAESLGHIPHPGIDLPRQGQMDAARRVHLAIAGVEVEPDSSGHFAETAAAGADEGGGSAFFTAFVFPVPRRSSAIVVERTPRRSNLPGRLRDVRRG